MTTKNTIKYFAYVRKSTEGEERQALSIDSQKDKVKEIHPNLDIVDVLEEKHSAFKPYNRPVFEDMIKRIKKGEARGIIAWHPDRLSRNEIDASTITYLVRTGIIHDLKFASYNFDNSPEGIMMLQLALSQSQYFSSKLGKDVKRGLEKKVSLGWRPGIAPEGYLNDLRREKGHRIIIVDKERSTLLRKAFDLFLTGTYTAQEVFDKLNNEWHYKTIKKKNSGGKNLSRSSWYKILSNPFYAGIIVYSGKESKGKHKPLLSLNEFNRIQELLGKRGCKRQPTRRDFTYAGMFKCAVCRCSITAEQHTKYIKSKKKVKGYNYYHCTHKRKDFVCKERSVEEKEITKNITSIVEKLSIHPHFLNLTINYLDEQKGREQTHNKIVEKNQNEEIKELEDQLSELIIMRSKKLIGDDTFLKQKNTLSRQIEKFKNTDNKKVSESDLIELTKEKFSFSAHALEKFKEGDKTEKKEVVANLGSNREIKDKKVLISVYNWLNPILENAQTHNAKLTRLEPLKFPLTKRKNEALASLNLSWLGDKDSNLDKQIQNLLSYH